MIESLSAASFLPLRGQSFRVTLPGGHASTATLIEVKEHGPSPRPDLRAPFALTFEVPIGPTRPEQGTWHLEHAMLGSLDLFAVPIGADSNYVRWQIVFG